MENNKLIAEFMGYGKIVDTQFNDGEGNWFDLSLFRTSWDWLMHVVQKIESTIEPEINFTLYAFGVEVYRRNETGDLVLLLEVNDSGVGRLVDTYTAVVDFIKWYNKQK